METGRTDGDGAIISVVAWRAGAVVSAVEGEMAASGAILARREDARVVEFASAAVVARVAKAFETGWIERYLTLARHARSVQQTF